MNTSVIQYRVADFLKRYAPFDSLPQPELLEIAGSGRVKFHESEEYVFRQRQEPGRALWVIQQGTVELFTEQSTGEILHDILAEGDLLGLDRFTGSGGHLYSARTASDVILYSIDAARFESLVSRFSIVKEYVAAHFSASSSGMARNKSWLDTPLPPQSFVRARGRNCDGFPVVAEASSTREAVHHMLKAGTEAVQVGGAALSADDLSLFCNRNPIRLIREIRAARSIEELGPLARQASRLVRDALARPSDVDDCLLLSTEFSAVVADSCIRLAAGSSTIRCCWVAFGGLARGELLHACSPRIAVIFEDGEDQRNDYFSALAREVAAFLAEYSMGDGSGRPEESLCMPLSKWKCFYTETIEDPIGSDLYARREFLDVRLLAGDAVLLAELQRHVSEAMAENDSLIPLLANDTLSNLPPLTFFRGLVMGMDGRKATSFRLADAALNPISDAARVFSLSTTTARNTKTLDRLADAAAARPENAQMFHDAAEAFRIALYYQANFAGAPIEPASLSQYDRRLLKTTFSSILRLLEFTAPEFL